MTEKLKQIIKDEVAKLPKEHQEGINAFDWVKVTEELGKKYSLSESELSNFQVETLLILVGLEDPDYYEKNIENEVGLSGGEAKELSLGVFQQIFTPINDLIIENIKKSPKNKNSKWDQNLNFIISGGNYSSFMLPTADKTETNSLLKNTTTETKLVI